MTDNRLYFACIDLSERRVLVVGAGPVAYEKIEGLLSAGARVHVVAPEACGDVARLTEDGTVSWERKSYETSDLDGAFLVVAATGDGGTSERVHADAEERSMLVNVADVPRLCNFILPAVHREGPIAVAVSTGGASPALAQRLRSEIAALVDSSYAGLARVLASLRPWARDNLPSYADRKAFFDDIVKGPDDPVAMMRDAGVEAVDGLVAAAKERALASRGDG